MDGLDKQTLLVYLLASSPFIFLCDSNAIAGRESSCPLKTDLRLCSRTWTHSSKILPGTAVEKILLDVIGNGHNASSTAQGSGGSFKDRKPVGEVTVNDGWQSEPTHGPISVWSVGLYICLSIGLTN